MVQPRETHQVRGAAHSIRGGDLAVAYAAGSGASGAQPVAELATPEGGGRGQARALVEAVDAGLDEGERRVLAGAEGVGGPRNILRAASGTTDVVDGGDSSVSRQVGERVGLQARDAGERRLKRQRQPLRGGDAGAQPGVASGAGSDGESSRLRRAGRRPRAGRRR